MMIPSTVLALHRLCAKDRIGKFDCHGVLFERDEFGVPWAVATEIHALLAVTWTEPEDAAAKVNGFSRNVLGSTVKAFADLLDPVRLTWVTLNEESEGFQFGAQTKSGVVSLAGACLDKFPPWAKVIDKPGKAVLADFDPYLMAMLCEVAGAVAADHEVWIDEDDGTVTVGDTHPRSTMSFDGDLFRITRSSKDGVIQAKGLLSSLTKLP